MKHKHGVNMDKKSPCIYYIPPWEYVRVLRPVIIRVDLGMEIVGKKKKKRKYDKISKQHQINDE